MNKIFFYIAVLMAFTFSSCKKDAEAPRPDFKKGLIKIATAYAPGAATRVELWAEQSLKTGYQHLSLALYDSVSNQEITQAEVKILPMMEMNMNGQIMAHSAPYENPESQTALNTLFPCAATFTMPGMDENGKWRLDVLLKREGQSAFSKATLPLQVEESQPARVKFISIDDANLIVSYIQPGTPKVGLNDFELVIYRRQDMMTYPAAEDYTVIITPEMPSMGHGSPNNINPVHIRQGHYKGKVNFTMTGDWKINLSISKNGQSADTSFDLTF